MPGSQRITTNLLPKVHPEVKLYDQDRWVTVKQPTLHEASNLYKHVMLNRQVIHAMFLDPRIRLS